MFELLRDDRTYVESYLKEMELYAAAAIGRRDLRRGIALRMEDLIGQIRIAIAEQTVTGRYEPLLLRAMFAELRADRLEALTIEQDHEQGRQLATNRKKAEKRAAELKAIGATTESEIFQIAADLEKKKIKPERMASRIEEILAKRGRPRSARHIRTILGKRK